MGAKVGVMKPAPSRKLFLQSVLNDLQFSILKSSRITKLLSPLTDLSSCCRPAAERMVMMSSMARKSKGAQRLFQDSPILEAEMLRLQSVTVAFRLSAVAEPTERSRSLGCGRLLLGLCNACTTRSSNPEFRSACEAIQQLGARFLPIT